MIRRTSLRIACFYMALAAAAPASAYFGKNKVQYYKYDWQILAGDHVDLYFYRDERDLAAKAAAFAEEGWDDLARRTGFAPRRRVPLVLYSSHSEFEETNILPYILPEGVAGFTELFKNRVVIPFDGSYPRLRRVIGHELVHYFMYEMLRDVYTRHHRYDYGAPPFWFVEGLAEYFSGESDPVSEMVLADALYADAFVPLTKGPALAGTYLGYKEGESALRYLAATYGEDKVTAVLDGAWLSRDFNTVFDLTLPKSFKEFDEEWQRWVRGRYWPRYADRVEFKSLGEGLSTGDGFRSGLAWLDRRRLVYLADEDGYASVYMLTLDDDGKVEDKQILVRGEKTPSYVTVHVYQERLGTWGGRLVGFVARAGPRDRLNVYDVAAREVVARYTFPDLVTLGAPSFSPDGGEIVFRGVTRTGRTDLYTVNRATGEKRRLTDDDADDAYPCWTPGGIVFASGRDAARDADSYNLYFMNGATGVTQRLTAGPWRDLYPATGDDGALYFVSDRDGYYDVYRRDAGTGDVARMSASLTGVLEAAPRPQSPAGEAALLGIADQNYEMRLADLAPVAPEATKTGVTAPVAAPPEVPSLRVFPVKGYRAKYSLDYFTAQVAYGPEFGSQTGVVVSLTDQLNDRNILVQVGNDAETLDDFLARTSVGVDYYDLHHRVGYGGGAFHYVNDYFDYRSGVSGLFYSETRAGAGATATYPLDRFHRVGASLYGYELERRWEILTRPPEYGTKVAPYFSAARDTSLWFRDGPVDGQRLEATVGVTEDVRRGRTDYLYTLADIRHYLRTTRTQCFAFRGAFVGTFGPDARPLYTGGSLSMRGYKFFDFRGRRLAIANMEYRFPVLEPFPLRTAVGTATMPPVRGALFFDAGAAWDEGLPRPRGGFGLGLRVILGSVVTLRTDHTVLTDFSSLGPFVPIKFFVGWDY